MTFTQRIEALVTSLQNLVTAAGDAQTALSGLNDFLDTL